MSTKDDGGPAFPCDGYQTNWGANLPISGLSETLPLGERLYLSAQVRYAEADAMLKARQS